MKTRSVLLIGAIAAIAVLEADKCLADSSATIDADPPPPEETGSYLYSDPVSLSYTEASPAPTPSQCPPDGTWQLQSKDYSWSGDVKGSPGNSPTADLDTDKKGSLSATCALTYNYKSGTTTDTAADSATFNGETDCPKQTASVLSTSCGSSYGALLKYCYTGADGWWFYENITGSVAWSCSAGSGVTSATNPQQSGIACIGDQIYNPNGPPATVANCSDTTHQTVYCGPTQARVNDCTYNNTQVLTVTRYQSNPPGGTVTVSSAGASGSCNW